MLVKSNGLNSKCRRIKETKDRISPVNKDGSEGKRKLSKNSSKAGVSKKKKSTP